MKQEANAAIEKVNKLTEELREKEEEARKTHKEERERDPRRCTPRNISTEELFIQKRRHSNSHIRAHKCPSPLPEA
jgi:hypothetical protein